MNRRQTPANYQFCQLSYRPEIDGLRAVAVVAVILFHINPAWLPGGFVGVDIFFVISGYLITGVIHSQWAENRFSIREFFLRRVRRILPVSLVVGIATLAVGRMIFFGPQLVELVESAAAHLTCVSNIYFYCHLDYFNDNVEMKPFIHTWSLAVEEQFYLIYPFVLAFVLRRFRSQHSVAMVSVAVWFTSLACSEFLLRRDSTAAFYLTPSRFWELLTGALIWFLPSAARFSREVRNRFSIVSVFLLFGSFVCLTSWMPFPGLFALLPCLSTAAIIYAESDERTVVGHSLALQPCVWVGKLSYSLYLWHWPVLVYLRYLTYPQLSLFWAMIAVLVTFFLSTITYYFVERPLRARHRTKAASEDSATKSGVHANADQTRFPRDTKRALLVVAGMFAVYVGVLGVTQREMSDQERLAHDAKEREAIVMQYMKANKDSSDYPAVDLVDVLDRTVTPCVEGTSGRCVAVWGDSHAMAIMPALVPFAVEHNVRLEQLAGGGNVPLLKEPFTADQGATISAETNELIFNYLLDTRPDVVILCGYWANYSQYRPEIFARRVQMTADALIEAKLTAYWVCDTANFAQDVPHELAKRIRLRKSPGTIRMSREEYNRDNAVVLEQFTAFDSPFLKVLDPAAYLTDANGDWIGNDGTEIYYRDRDHLTTTGAELLKPLFEPIFADLATNTPRESSVEAAADPADLLKSR